jgi:nucleotide-binding universal stress UspA family protein
MSGETVMFKKILLPVDLSNRHGPALEIGQNLARQNRAEIILLHVIELIAGLSMGEEKDFYQKLEKVAEARLKKLEARVGLRKVPHSRRILFGHRGPTIIKYAKELGADLIVLTAPQVDLRNPSAGWGSLSYKVSILARCPVLLVK